MTSRVQMVINPIAAADMEINSIYLDGAVRGTVIDPERNSYSFDHHGEGVRFALTSSCFQMAMAVNMGLDMSTIKTIYVSSIDADSVLSTFIALNPESTLNLEFVKFLQDISRVDNHGFPALIPGEALYNCFFALALNPRAGESETLDLLLKKVEMAEEMYKAGTLMDKGVDQKLPGIAVALDADGHPWHSTEGEVSFEEVYSNGSWGLILGENADKSLKVTVGKKPFALVGDLNGLWAHMSELEPEGQTWGGGDSIGGSPFKVGTVLTPAEIMREIRNWVKLNK